MEIDRHKIAMFIREGEGDRYWYTHCQNLLISIYGMERLPLIANLFAATSINSSLKSNIRLFRRALHEIDCGLPRGKYLPVMALQIDRIRAGEPIQGRKIRSFAAAIQGDRDAVVVDTWLARAFNMARTSPRTQPNGTTRDRATGVGDKVYTTIENYCRTLADEMNIEARQVSAMIWCGIRRLQTRDYESSYHNILKHQLYNMYETFQNI